jgi:hypothetical protein
MYSRRVRGSMEPITVQAILGETRENSRAGRILHAWLTCR